MIPKIIHYCWFGGSELPAKAKKCIASWKKYCPDYEIIEWNEENFDVNMNAYTKMCYEQEKYAFLTDYIRLVVVEEQGGIYFDTDVEILRSFDDLLDCKAFFGFEDENYINTGVGFGSEPKNIVIRQMLKEYTMLLDGMHGTIGCPILNTQALDKLGLKRNGKKQNISEAIIYPRDYFNPYDDATGIVNKTENTYSIHWFAKSWLDKKMVLRSKLTKPFHRIFGTNCFNWLKKN